MIHFEMADEADLAIGVLLCLERKKKVVKEPLHPDHGIKRSIQPDSIYMAFHQSLLRTQSPEPEVTL